MHQTPRQSAGPPPPDDPPDPHLLLPRAEEVDEGVEAKTAPPVRCVSGMRIVEDSDR